MKFDLYYLLDQSGDVNGDKVFVNEFENVDAAKAQALEDKIEHFSIEEQTGEDTFTIVFIC